MVESINIHIGLTGEEEIQRQLAQTATSFAAATKNISALGSTMEQALNGAAAAAQKFGASATELQKTEGVIRALNARAGDSNTSFAQLAANYDKARNSAGQIGAGVADAVPKFAALSKETETLAARILHLGTSLSGLGQLGALVSLGKTGGGAGLAVAGITATVAGLLKLASSAAAAAKQEETAILDAQLKIQAAYQATADARQKLSDLALQAGRDQRTAALSDRNFADQRQQNIRTEESAEINLARLKLQAARDSGRISQAQFDQESRLLDARSKRIAILQADQAVVNAARAQADADAKRAEELEDRKRAAIKRTADQRKEEIALVQQLRDEDKLLEEEGQKTRIDRKLTGAGLVLSEQDRNALKDFQEALKTLETTFDRLKQKFAAGFASALTEQLDKVTAGALNTGKVFEGLGEATGGFLGRLARADFNPFTLMLQGMGDAAIQAAKKFGLIASSAKEASDAATQLADAVERPWKPAIDKASQYIRTLDEIKDKSSGLRTIIPRQLPPEKLAQTEQDLAPRLGETNEERAKRLKQAMDDVTASYNNAGGAATQAGAEMDKANKTAIASAQDLAGHVDLLAEKYAKAAQAARDAAISAKATRDEAERDIMTGQKQISAFDTANMVFASGGLVRGRAGRDTNLAWLSNLEYVMRPEAVRKYGVGLMHTINSMQFPGFAMGGLNLTAPAFAAGGAARAQNSSRVMHLTIGDQTFRNLTAPESTAKQLERASIIRQTSSTGIKPSWRR